MDVLPVVWRRQWMVWASVLLFCAIGFIYLSQATPIFQSSAKLHIQKSVPKLIAETVSQQYGATASSLVTDCQIIQSTAIIADAVQSAGLRDLGTLRAEENPIGRIQTALKVEPDTQGGQIVNVSVTSTNPEDAPAIVNGVVESYIAYVGKQQQNSASTVLKILQGEKQKREGELNTVQQKIIEFQRTNGILSFEDNRDGERHSGGNIITTRLAELADLHTKAEVAAMDVKIAADMAQSLKSKPDELRQWIRTRVASMPMAAAAVYDNSALWSELQRTTRSLQQLELQYGTSYPSVKLGRQQMELLQSQLKDLDEEAMQNYLGYLRVELTAAQRREKELSDELAKQRDAALDLNSKAAEYSQLQVDARRTERLLDVLDNRIKEVDVNSDAGSTVVNVLEFAKPTKTPVFPRRSLVLGAAIALGLLFGIGSTLVADRLDHRLRSADEIARLLGVPVLGVIPHMERRRTMAERGQVVQLEPRSDVAESYRTLRTGISFGYEFECRTILITSPMPSDGKSTCASNLALALAQAENRVLLIDADCRRPVQHKIFGHPGTEGLTQVLQGTEKVETLIRASGFDRLDLLACGEIPEKPAELLNGAAFRRLLEELADKYDRIVIDSPPLVPVTDAQIISTMTDATVLVLRAEKSTRRVTEHARDALAGVGGVLLGTVVNDAPRGRGRYGYYYGYSGSYKYGYRYSYESKRVDDSKTKVGLVRAQQKMLQR